MVTGTEWAYLDEDRSVLVDRDQTFVVATSLRGDALLSPETAGVDTGDRWLRLSEDEIDEVSERAAALFGSAASLIYRGGMSVRAIRALTVAGETTLIGREVASGRATTNYLVEGELDGAPLPIEVWVSDDGDLVQMRFLTDDEYSEAVEITLRPVERTELERRTYPPDALTVSTAELEDEAEREEAAIEERRREEEEAAAKAREELSDAEKNPLSGDDVTEEDVRAALQRREALGEILDLVFVLDEVGQLCTGYFDMLENGSEVQIFCERRLTAAAVEVVCPAVESFFDAVESGLARSQIATLAAELPELLAANADTGLTTTWRIFTPDDGTPATIELLTSEQAATTLMASAENVAEVWATSADAFQNGASETAHMRLALTCDRDVPGGFLDILNSEQPPGPLPRPTTPGAAGQDPLASSLPISPGQQGNAVAQLQRLLIVADESLYPDGADGSFGTMTQIAVEAVQSRSGLPVTGVVDAATLSALRSIEASEGAAPYSSSDPICPTRDEVIAEYGSGTGDYGPATADYVLCSGQWASAVVTYPDFADGTKVILQRTEGFWRYAEAWSGDPRTACTSANTPAEHWPPLDC